jgi:hypothetical protein
MLASMFAASKSCLSRQEDGYFRETCDHLDAYSVAGFGEQGVTRAESMGCKASFNNPTPNVLLLQG